MGTGTILYIGGFEMPDKNAAAHRVLSNAKLLKAMGYNVVFVGSDKGIDKSVFIMDTLRTFQGFDSYAIAYPKSAGEWIGYLSSISSIRRVIESYPDTKAVICYNYPAVQMYRIKKYLSSKNVKIIADCTEWYSTKGSSPVFKIIKGLDSFFRMRVLQKRLDGLILISKFLENYYSSCNNITVIPPLVDLNEDKWKHKESPGIATETDERIRLVYAGSPGRNKDKLNLVIEMLNKLQNPTSYHLTIIGLTKDEYLKYYGEHHQILDTLGKRVAFIGRINHTESIRLVQNSDFSIFIRDDSRVTRAGFPTKFVESISCGTPVITTRTSDLEDYLIEGENGYFVDMSDMESASVTFSRILNLPREEIERMKSFCQNSRKFHYEKYIDQAEHWLSHFM